MAPLDGAGKPDLPQKEYIRCDTLLVAAGLIPEAELFKSAELPMDKAGGIPCDSQ